MIDYRFITRYTTGLYGQDREIHPRYEEFRDMFSTGQLQSKSWAVKCLAPYLEKQRVVIAGSWFGTLGIMLYQVRPEIEITLMDLDARCKAFVDTIVDQGEKIKSVTQDMYSYRYTEDVVINTSCEHIQNLSAWLELIPKGTLVLLQSNNNTSLEGHINCPSSIEEFEQKAGIKEILYSGELIMPMYTRYMIIGKR